MGVREYNRELRLVVLVGKDVNIAPLHSQGKDSRAKVTIPEKKRKNLSSQKAASHGDPDRTNKKPEPKIKQTQL